MTIKNPPIIIGFEITSKCNLSCTHCPVRGKNIGPDLQDFRETVFIINKTLKKYHKLVFWFTGGEPCIRKDLVCEVSKEISNLGIELNICTNGTFLIDKKIQYALLNYFNKIFISIDSPFNSNDLLRKGISSDEIWRNVDEFIKSRGSKTKPEVIIKTMLSKWNISHIDQLVKDVFNIGVDHLELRPIQKQPNHEKEIKSYYLDFRDLPALKKFKNLAEKYYPFIIFSDIYYSKVVDYILGRLNSPKYCKAGIEHLFFTNELNLLPCCAYYPRNNFIKLRDFILALNEYSPLSIKRMMENHFGKSFHCNCKDCLFIQNYN